MARVRNSAPDCPLSPADCERINAVLQRTPALLQLALTCEECGWDVDAAKQALQEQLDIATKAKAAFFPDRI